MVTGVVRPLRVRALQAAGGGLGRGGMRVVGRTRRSGTWLARSCLSGMREAVGQEPEIAAVLGIASIQAVMAVLARGMGASI